MFDILLQSRPERRSELAPWYEALLEEAEAQGFTIAEAADAIGVSVATLYSWRRRLESGEVQGQLEGAGLVRVKLREDDQRSDWASSHLVIHVGGGRSIEVPPGFEAGELTRLVRVLESC
jgi:hypothetical protein